MEESSLTIRYWEHIPMQVVMTNEYFGQERTCYGLELLGHEVEHD